MRTFFGCLVGASMAVMTACGGTSTSLDGGDAGAEGDAGGTKDGSAPDAGCVNPVLDASCSADAAVCGQEGDGNPCCDQAWQCLGGHWKSLAAACACAAPSQACGEKTCKVGQYCKVQPPGISFADGGVPPTDYECQDPPSSCGATATCPCLEAAPPCTIGSCTDSAGGAPSILTVNCIGE